MIRTYAVTHRVDLERQLKEKTNGTSTKKRCVWHRCYRNTGK